MNWKHKLIASFAAIASLLLVAHSAVAQTMDLEEVQVVEGTSEVTVEWTWLGDGDVRSVGVDITFDENLLDPQTTTDPIFGEIVDGCITQEVIDETDNRSCVLTDPDTIRLALQRNPGEGPLPSFDPGGSITFDIASGAEVGDSSVLAIVVFDTEPGDPGDINTDDGLVEVVDTPPEEISELTVTPDPLDFGTVDLGNMPQTLDITAENTGGSASSLTISAAAYNGDPEFSIVANGCDGTTLGAGDTCSVTVEFDAAADGSFTGAVDFSSDADDNPNPSVSVLGSADSVAALSINPPSGNVNLGSGLQGDVLSTNAVISNNGSADGTFDCTLTDPSGVFSADPLNGTVAAGGSESVALSCSLPAEAEDGDSFAATFSCTGSEGFSSEHELSCSVSEWEPLPVPTMQKWSLILFALMMLIAGGIGIRFFRA